jgi:hypothetical protein
MPVKESSLLLPAADLYRPMVARPAHTPRLIPDRASDFWKDNPGVSDGWRYGNQNTHIGCCPYAMRFGYIRNQDIPWLCLQHEFFSSKKLTAPLEDDDAELAFYVVGMHRQLLARLEIEVQDLEVRGIMDQESLQGMS